MKTPVIKRQTKIKETYQEKVRDIPKSERVNVQLRRIKGKGPGGTVSPKQIDWLLRAYDMNKLVWLENTNERLWETIKFQRSRLLKYEESIEFMLNEFELSQEELYKKYYEVIRSYNALITFNKSAEELGVDMKKHKMELPESKRDANDYEFSARQEVLESGRIRNILELKPKPHLREKFQKEYRERQRRKKEEGKK